MSESGQLYVGQLNVPERDAVRQAFRDIFERRFYTNHGPLVAEFERQIADRLEVAHAICMTNATVALMVAMKAAGLSGKAVVPAFTFPATVQAMTFAGLEPVFCDVDPRTHNINAETVREVIAPDCNAIVGVHMWGRRCDDEGLSSIAEEQGAALVYDAAHAFDCVQNGKHTGGSGLFEVFSFHATKILNCTEGGCVTTNDDQLAAAIRTAANFHDRPGDVPVSLRINAKMSEAQAAMGILALENLDSVIAANQSRYDQYRRRLTLIPGIRFVDHAAGMYSNCQYVVTEVEESFPVNQQELMAYLKNEGIIARRYFYPGMHEAPPYNARRWDLPVTDSLCNRVLQLPSGSMVAEADIDRICDIIESVAV